MSLLVEGVTDDRGINYRALSHLFTMSKHRAAEIVDTFHISILEVYNESLRDLLVPKNIVMDIYIYIYI